MLGNSLSKMSGQSILGQSIKISTTESKWSYKFCSILLAIVITSLSLVLMSTGATPINAIPWDVILLLDGGWRIFNGQIPHTDYYNPIGPLTYSLVALGMKVTRPSTSAIAYGNVILFVLITPWAWVLARSRLSAVAALVFAGFMGFLLVAPRALGFDVGWTTYAMLYNRQGFVLLSMLLLELFTSPRASVKPKYFVSGLSCGILLALLFFCKISYFSIGAIAVLIHIVLFRRSRLWLLACFSSFLLICIGVQIFFHIDIPSYIADIRFAGRLQYLPYRVRLLKDTIKGSFLQACLVFIPLLFSADYLIRNQAKNDRFFQEIRIWIVTLFVTSSGLLLCIGNAQNGKDIPLFFTAAIIVFEYFRREMTFSERSIRVILGINLLSVTLFIIVFLLANIFFKDIRSLAYSVTWTKSNLPYPVETQRFQSANLNDFVIPETTDATTVYWKARDLPRNINEGLTLLRKHLVKESRIFSMSYTNPFPFALGLPSPKGVALWWDKGISFNQEFYPDAEKVFSDTDIVMVPDVVSSRDPGCCIETPDLMKELYEDYLKTYFIEKDRSEFWTLLIKR